MARKRIEAAAPLEDWNGVSAVLAEIGALDRGIAGVEMSMQQKIDAAKADAAAQIGPLREEKARLETQIAAFADQHRADLGDKKSRTLYFGTVGYRKSTRVILPKAPTRLAEIVIRLRARGMHDCVIAKPDAVDRDALKKYPEADIVEVGAKLEVKDTFWYEVDRERLGEN